MRNYVQPGDSLALAVPYSNQQDILGISIHCKQIGDKVFWWRPGPFFTNRYDDKILMCPLVVFHLFSPQGRPRGGAGTT